MTASPELPLPLPSPSRREARVQAIPAWSKGVDPQAWPCRCGIVRGAGAPARMSKGGRLMFENQQKDQIEALMKSDTEFRSLFQRHQELDSKLRDADLGVLPMDDTTMHSLKKEKLWTKDRLQHMWEVRQPTH
jgi:uncharacterized protein YdcH (DUF465 family)